MKRSVEVASDRMQAMVSFFDRPMFWLLLSGWSIYVCVGEGRGEEEGLERNKEEKEKRKRKGERWMEWMNGERSRRKGEKDRNQSRGSVE